MEGKIILVTGGTGSFGQQLIKRILELHPKKVIVFSRDEFKQSEMKREFDDPRLRFFLGDVRDRNRLKRAFAEVDYVVHAAAYKQVDALEYNPHEAVKTNVIGAMNIVNAAIDCGVERTVFISSDKAVNPTNIYGATKFTAERIFIAANSYSGHKGIFSCVRYGNVIGSRGSVIPLFQRLASERKPITVTDERMTRFWITYDQAVELVLTVLCESVGGEIFVPRIPSMKIVDVARTIAPDSGIVFTGIRPGGEKLHETLISSNEARSTSLYLDCYVIIPECHQREGLEKYSKFPSPYEYKSDTNDQWLTQEGLKSLLSAESMPAAI